MPVTLLRTSERSTYKRCRQAWWWAYEEGWQPKTAGPALRFGSLVHEAMEVRYPPGTRRGPHPAETFQKLYDAELDTQLKFGFRDEDGTWADAAEIGVSMLESFVDEYGDDDRYEVIASEQTFKVRIAKDLAYVGTFDGVWRDRQTGAILLKEWKTTNQFWTSHLALDEQAGSYWAFAPPWLKKKGILKDKANLKGILYTFMRRAKPDPRPRNDEGQALNKDGSVSKRQPSPMFERHLTLRDRHESKMVRARAIAQAREMQLVREGVLSVDKSPGRYHCGACAFVDVCELHETGADYRPLLRAGFEKYDPYAAHLIQQEGK